MNACLKHILFIWLSIICSSVSYAQLVRPCGTEKPFSTETVNQQLNSITFATDSVVWAVGANGTMLKSTDAGNTWQLQDKITFYQLNAVWFTSKDTGYIAGDSSNYGLMLKTTDGGLSWKKQYYGNSNYNSSFSLFFTNKNTGYVGGSSRLGKTTNGGTNWQNTNLGSGVISDIHFINKDTGYAVNGSYIYKTINAGANWNLIFNSGSVTFTSIHFATKDTGYVCGLSGYIYRTINGGSSWSLHLDINPSIRDIDFVSQDTGYISTSGGSGYGLILKTYDRGTTWTYHFIYLNTDLDLRSIAKNKLGRIIAVSKYGDIVVSDDDCATWQNKKQKNKGAAYFLTKSNRGIYYFAGDSANIYTTSNNGNTFTKIKYSNSNNAIIRELAWPYKDTAFIYGSYSGSYSFRRTFNGGTTWSSVPSYTAGTIPSNISNITFPTSNNGFLSTYYNVYRTTNAGNTWAFAQSGDTNLVRDLYFLNKDTGFACGNNGKFSRTTNGGISWVKIPSAQTAHFLSTCFLNKDIGFVGTTNGKLFKTIDGGTTWQQKLNLSISVYVNEIKFINSKVGFIALQDGGLNYNILKTIDGGNTWKTWDYNYFYSSLGYIEPINEDTIWVTSNGNLFQLYNLYPTPPKQTLNICDSGNVSINLTPYNQYPYNWYYDESGNNFAFAGNSFNANNITNSDTLYYAIADSMYYCESKKASVVINVTPTPAKPYLNYIHDTTLCFQQSLIVQPITNHQNYIWNNGVTTKSLTVNQSGVYSVIVNDNGCSSISSDSINVNINSPLPQPVIVPDNQDTLFSSMSNSYYHFWFLNNTLLVDTTHFIIPITSGVYTCYIKDTLDCISDTSLPYNYLVTDVKHQEVTGLIYKIMPNPSNGDKTEIVSSEEIQTLTVSSSIGELLYVREVKDTKFSLHTKLKPGIYYITILTKTKSTTKTLIIVD